MYFTSRSPIWHPLFFLFFLEKRRSSMCVGCGSPITDQYILRVSPDLEWHAACLKCADCHQFLDETCTCYVREGKTYCKRDYFRWGLWEDRQQQLSCKRECVTYLSPKIVWPSWNLSHIINNGNNIDIAEAYYQNTRSLTLFNWGGEWRQIGPSFYFNCIAKLIKLKK